MYTSRTIVRVFVATLLVYFVLVVVQQSGTFQKSFSRKNLEAGNHSLTKSLHDNWIVVTTVSPPTADIAALAAIPGWQLLVVGDIETPSNWSFPGCIYLGIEQQKTLGYSITDLIPNGSYARKNIGYLYAIQHGAQFIYDTVDDYHPTNGKLNFHLGPKMSGLLYADTSRSTMNPFAHFGQPTIWPRGFPLEKATEENNFTYTLTHFTTPAIQQGLVNGDPDVDSIYILLKNKPNMTSLDVTFDHCAPPISLPEGVFAPFNSQNTLFHRDAFWALLLPASVTFRADDIWRGYWAQRLLWLIGQQLSFFPPDPVQIRNPRNYLVDLNEEHQFHTQSGNFIEILSSWSCSRNIVNTTFFECIAKLSDAMMESAFFAQRYADLVRSWLVDLESVGYQQPQLDRRYQKMSDEKVAIILPKITDRTVLFSPATVYGIESQFERRSERRLDLLAFCDDQFEFGTANKLRMNVTLKPRYSFSSFLLVVVFNFPFHANIKFLNTLYGDHFPNVVMCSQTNSYGELIEEVNRGMPLWRQRQITFLNISSHQGYFGYECAIRAMEMNYQVDGYFVVGDDVMLNTWNLKTIDVERVYLTRSTHRFQNRHQSAKRRWIWWDSPLGRNATDAALLDIERMANCSYRNRCDDQSELMRSYISNRRRQNLSMENVSFCLADLYYVPRSKSLLFQEVMKIFLQHRVFLEIAVPTALVGLTEIGFDKKRFWGNDVRARVLSAFSTFYDYAHPLKLSKHLPVDKRKKYCNSYIRELMTRW